MGSSPRRASRINCGNTEDYMLRHLTVVSEWASQVRHVFITHPEATESTTSLPYKYFNPYYNCTHLKAHKQDLKKRTDDKHLLYGAHFSMNYRQSTLVAKVGRINTYCLQTHDGEKVFTHYLAGGIKSFEELTQGEKQYISWLTRESVTLKKRILIHGLESHNHLTEELLDKTRAFVGSLVDQQKEKDNQGFWESLAGKTNRHAQQRDRDLLVQTQVLIHLTEDLLKQEKPSLSEWKQSVKAYVANHPNRAILLNNFGYQKTAYSEINAVLLALKKQEKNHADRLALDLDNNEQSPLPTQVASYQECIQQIFLYQVRLEVMRNAVYSEYQTNKRPYAAPFPNKFTSAIQRCVADRNKKQEAIESHRQLAESPCNLATVKDQLVRLGVMPRDGSNERISNVLTSQFGAIRLPHELEKYGALKTTVFEAISVLEQYRSELTRQVFQLSAALNLSVEDELKKINDSLTKTEPVIYLDPPEIIDKLIALHEKVIKMSAWCEDKKQQLKDDMMQKNAALEEAHLVALQRHYQTIHAEVGVLKQRLNKEKIGLPVSLRRDIKPTDVNSVEAMTKTVEAVNNQRETLAKILSRRHQQKEQAYQQVMGRILAMENAINTVDIKSRDGHYSLYSNTQGGYKFDPENELQALQQQVGKYCRDKQFTCVNRHYRQLERIARLHVSDDPLLKKQRLLTSLDTQLDLSTNLSQLKGLLTVMTQRGSVIASCLKQERSRFFSRLSHQGQTSSWQQAIQRIQKRAMQIAIKNGVKDPAQGKLLKDILQVQAGRLQIPTALAPALIQYQLESVYRHTIGLLIEKALLPLVQGLANIFDEPKPMRQPRSATSCGQSVPPKRRAAPHVTAVF